MAYNFEKVPGRISLDRKVTFFNNSVIYKNIELKIVKETNFEPLFEHES